MEGDPLAIEDQYVSGVVVWFEDNAAGRAALTQAHELAREWLAELTVVTVAVHERVIGCGRCLQGTVLWNIEMKKIAHEELLTARRILEGAERILEGVERILEGAERTSYELLVGDPAQVISEAAVRADAQIVVLPRQREGRLAPPNRRHVPEQVGARGAWRVIVAPGRASRIGRRGAAGEPARARQHSGR
jgi:hypothetical protein